MHAHCFFWWGELVAFVAALMLVACIFLKHSWRRVSDLLMRGLFWEMLAVWAVGVALYTHGFDFAGSQGHFLATVPRAMLSALQMFLFQINLNDVSPCCAADTSYMVLFSLTHFVAVLLTWLCIFKLLGFRARTLLRLARYAWFSKKKPCLNIFWGLDDAAYLLAKDILKTHGADNAVVFVHANDELHEPIASEAPGINRMLHIRPMRQTEIERLSSLDACLTECDVQLSAAAESDDPELDLFARLHLRLLRRIVAHTQREIRFFFLSDQETVNVQQAWSVLRDRALLPGKQVKIYVHARQRYRELFDLQLERLAAAGRWCPEIHVVDSSYLSVMALKRNPEAHPVRFVSVDRTAAAVTSSFSALLVGFGEMGQEAFDFLYEFGALPGPGGAKIPVHYCAVDRSMEQLKGTFYMERPALRDEASVELCAAEIGSVAFWDKVRELLPTLNYAVVALGDDETSIDVAVALYRFACQVRRNDLARFKIYVRCYKLEHFNRLQQLVGDYNSANQASGGEILLFGDLSSLYTYRLVIDDVIQQEGKAFGDAYDIVYKGEESQPEESASSDASEPPAAPVPEAAAAETSAEAQEPELTALFSKQKERHANAQNCSNSLHKATKLHLLGLDAATEPDAAVRFRRLDELYQLTLTRPKEQIVYLGTNEADAALLLQLAKGEHLRWEAAHKLLGYRPGPEKDAVAKTHNCFCAWSELADDKLRSYDCVVVDTTLLQAWNDENKAMQSHEKS